MEWALYQISIIIIIIVSINVCVYFQVLKGHDDHVITCLEFCGSRIVSGSDDNTLKVWSAITGKVRIIYAIIYHLLTVGLYYISIYKG